MGWYTAVTPWAKPSLATGERAICTAQNEKAPGWLLVYIAPPSALRVKQTIKPAGESTQTLWYSPRPRKDRHRPVLPGPAPYPRFPLPPVLSISCELRCGHREPNTMSCFLNFAVIVGFASPFVSMISLRSMYRKWILQQDDKALPRLQTATFLMRDLSKTSSSPSRYDSCLK